MDKNAASKYILRPCGLDEISSRTLKARLDHHLTCDWATTSQHWLFLNDGGTPFGDAMVVVGGRECYAVVNICGVVEVVACRGIMDALARLGHSNRTVEVR